MDELENLKKGTEKKKTISFTAVSKKLNGILDEPKEEISPTDDISSSDIRKKLKAGISVEAEIPASVNQYIFENRLFKDENDE